MANQVKTTFTGDINPLTRSMRAVEADIRKYQNDREKFERDLTRLTERETRNRERAQLTALRRYEQEMKRVFREEERLQQERASRAASFRQGAAGFIVGGAVGAGYLAQRAIQNTVEQARAQRLLAASATEAGLAQGTLAQKNREFAESVGLSTRAAAETTAQITRLATNTGNVQQLDRLLKAFADLGAARGIAGNDLNSLIGTILSGQDEGLNRLGIADPGQLYRAYAEGVGKTVEQLTQAEKVQAAVNAVLEKSAIFTGAAEARMNSLEGQAAKSTAAWENFTDALSATFTTSGPVTDFLNEASRLLGNLKIDLEDVNRQLAEGKTPREIAEGRRPTPGFTDYLSAFSLGGYGLPGVLGSTGLFGQGYKDAISPEKNRQRRVAEDEARIRATQLDNEKQGLAAQEQYVANYYKRAGDNFKSYSDNISQLVEADRKRTIEAEQAKQKAAEDTRKKLEEIRQAKLALVDRAVAGENNPFLTFLNSANNEMRQMLELAKNLSPALREAFVANAQRLNRNQLFGMRLDAQIEASQLRNRAAEFRQGFNNDLSDPATVQRLINQLFGNLGLPTFSNIGQSQFYNLRQDGSVDWESGSGLYRPIRRTPEQQALIDQRLIREAGNFDPSLLNQGQRNEVASAFEREATRRLNAEKNANDFYTNMNKLISDSGLKVSIGQGTQLDIVLDNQSSTNAAIGATEGAVKARYK